MGSAMSKSDPLVDELETAIEEDIQKYKAAGGSPVRVIAWFADYLGYMVKAQPTKLRDEIKFVVHQRICEMD
jgi:hypothetical protein